MHVTNLTCSQVRAGDDGRIQNGKLIKKSEVHKSRRVLAPAVVQPSREHNSLEKGGMQLNPNTKLGKLLEAIPSATTVCQLLKISVSGNEEKSLDEVCEEAGVAFDDFLDALNGLNWEEDYQGGSL